MTFKIYIILKIRNKTYKINYLFQIKENQIQKKKKHGKEIVILFIMKIF